MEKEERGGEIRGPFVKDATVLSVSYKLSTLETSEDILCFVRVKAKK